MKKTRPHGLMLLSIQMLVDALSDMQFNFEYLVDNDVPAFSGFLMYQGQTDLQHNVLYVLAGNSAKHFPKNRFSYITLEDIDGSAPHIRCVDCNIVDLTNSLIEIFQMYHEFELQLSEILTGGGTLTDLCHAGSDFFGNPIYIHDDMFTVIALSTRVEGMIKFEYNEQNGKMYIPLWLINDFKFDQEYQRTMELHHAGIWDNEHYPYNIRSVFVNLWDGSEYLGRMLVNELRNPLAPGQYQSLEILGKYAIKLMRRDGLTQSSVYQDFEDTFIDLLNGAAADPRDLRTMMSILEWHESDRFLCLKLRDQNKRAAIHTDTALSSELANVLNSFTCFHHQKNLCIVINLTLFQGDVNSIRRSLAPYIRDSLMYGGISNPVNGINSLCHGFRQADVALDYISEHDNSQWLIPFSACALSYIRDCATKEFFPEYLAEPELLELRKFDEANGTEYFVTLRTYLLNERNIQKTSDALIIHRTTLTYRLKKIDELIRFNLDDPVVRQYLIFSYYLLNPTM